MNKLRESFELREGPSDPEIQPLFRVFSEWARADVSIYDSLDFLERWRQAAPNFR